MRNTKSIPYLNAASAADVNRQNRSSFFASFRFLTPERRQALSVVYAFFRIVDDCVDEVSDPHDKKHALDFWAEELTAVYHGEPAQPVMRELQEVVRFYGIPENHFAGLIDGCRMDIEKMRYETMAELEAYCYRVAGLVGLTCMKIFGYESEGSEKAAIDLGFAFQLTNILRDVGNDLAIGRIYLPKDEMRRFGYSEEDLVKGIENENFFALMNEFYRLAHASYQLAFEEFRKDKMGLLLAARAMAEVYFSILKKIHRENYPVLRRKVRLNWFEKTKLMLPLLWKIK